MSLYNRSSLIQVPSLYKDGTLVSTIPEDRSGDFTVARGSNLAATRIGEDGYIKKGYENLLLQSNSFDTTPWQSVRVTPSTGFTGYDGTNDAWKIVPTTQLQEHNIRYNGSSVTGVWTFSIYAKAGGYDFISIIFQGLGSSGKIIDISPNQGVVVDNKGGVQAIDESITDVGNGWWKITLTYTGSVGTIFMATLPTKNTLQFAGDGTSGMYIQDAQLNQGLVAYPYLETTTAPAQGGLLENSPRLDWSNGVPAVKLEEQRTNLVSHSEYFGGWQTASSPTITPNAAVSPEGIQNAYLLTSTEVSSRVQVPVSPTGTNIQSVYIKYSGSDARVRISGLASASSRFEVNVNSSGVAFHSAESGIIDYAIEPVGNDWYRVTSTQSGGNYYQIYIDVTGNNGSIYIYGAQLEQDATHPTSYIPTYGTTQTRSNEVISDNFDIPTTATIYNSFYSDTAETVFVLDQVFNVAEGLNKVAIAFSPTAVKISVGGSIVANATGTYDTTALSNIQLGSNNGTDYSNAPISGFYVFPEFLTDEELNSLTD